MMRDILDFECKIKIEHKIFGANEIVGVIGNIIDDEERIGVIVHGKELYCYKNHENFSIIKENDMIIMSDDMMKIFIYVTY